MSEETIYESERRRTRRGIASYFRRLANAFASGEPVPADEEQTVTVDVPPEAEVEVDVEREDETMSLEIEIEWEGDASDVTTETSASKATFELFEDSAGEWRWRLVHDNGNIIADSGEGYSSRQKAGQGLESVRSNAPGAGVDDLSNDEEKVDSEGGSDATFELYEDSAGEWRWRLIHVNGEIIADGGEGYASKRSARQGLQSVQTNVGGAAVEDLE